MVYMDVIRSLKSKLFSLFKTYDSDIQVYIDSVNNNPNVESFIEILTGTGYNKDIYTTDRIFMTLYTKNAVKKEEILQLIINEFNQQGFQTYNYYSGDGTQTSYAAIENVRFENAGSVEDYQGTTIILNLNGGF